MARVLLAFFLALPAAAAQAQAFPAKPLKLVIPFPPGYEAANWWGIVAPAGTPAAILARLRREIAAILDAPEMHKRFEAEGAETARLSPEEFGEFIAAETAKWTRVVKDAGIKAE